MKSLFSYWLDAISIIVKIMLVAIVIYFSVYLAAKAGPFIGGLFDSKRLEYFVDFVLVILFMSFLIAITMQHMDATQIEREKRIRTSSQESESAIKLRKKWAEAERRRKEAIKDPNAKGVDQ